MQSRQELSQVFRYLLLPHELQLAQHINESQGGELFRQHNEFPVRGLLTCVRRGFPRYMHRFEDELDGKDVDEAVMAHSRELAQLSFDLAQFLPAYNPKQ